MQGNVQVQVNEAVVCPLCQGKEGETVMLWGNTPYPDKVVLFFKCVFCDYIFARAT